MKSTVLTVLLIAVRIVCLGQDEAQIYQAVIEEYVLKLRQPVVDRGSNATVTVIASPEYSNLPRLDDFPKFRTKYKKLSEETFDDFVNKFQDTIPFGQIRVKNVELVVFRRDSVPSRAELAARYPDWIFSIIELSNVGMNAGKDQALIYYSFNSGPGVGSGVYIVYEKKGKNWKQKAVIPAWAA